MPVHRSEPRSGNDRVGNQGLFCNIVGGVLADPSGLFNSGLEGNTRRAIDFRVGDELDEEALKALIRAAVALNTSSARG
jgi:hypothetical protein